MEPSRVSDMVRWAIGVSLASGLLTGACTVSVDDSPDAFMTVGADDGGTSPSANGAGDGHSAVGDPCDSASDCVSFSCEYQTYTCN